ncbi:GmrSD restriction endonuclease domain-containing protein [Lysobacter antibioticus]|uniref:Divergent AAA domain protein n=1 Tax=Lysobacter antibioticus TaxID=84531 RepID=A0A0S2FCM7_LYSAN|nr:DUF262 domain-containing protein [Lysobacter antibioticus]ALN81294.1 divergent AAA domain protein [Lysobacter antibioticus]
MATGVELAIRGENVQRLYGWYRENRFEVNRRYQRKLVWTISEKRAFIDSLLKGFPVPLILVAEYESGDVTRYEIIDGMQRMNALFSFIEQDFDLGGEFFDLDTMAETKHLSDKKELQQNFPRMARELCVLLASYPIPMSVYRIETEGDVDEVFRRINSNGKHLSRQELRIAGNTSQYANLVRNLSSRIRGDTSLSDVLPLSKMKLLSISNRDLPYGLDVDKIFWVEQGVITKDQLRDSTDEELISDTLGYILLEPKPASSSEILNGFYGLEVSAKESSRADDLDVAIKRLGEDAIIRQYLAVFDVLKKAIMHSGRRFNTLMFPDAGPRVPRYFQVVFLALHELLVVKERVPKAVSSLASTLNGIGRKIPISEGGRWSAKDRVENVLAVVGMLEPVFKKRTTKDPALASWATELENLLTQSTTEQGAFEFKQGLHRLDAKGSYDDKMVGKIVKTLAAMANESRGAIGYVLLGVADRKAHSDLVQKVYGSVAKEFGGFYISGVEGEIAKNYASSDEYLKKIVNAIKAQPIPDDFKNQAVRNIRIVKYFGKEVVVLKAEALAEPVVFDQKYYERHGNEVIEVKGAQVASLFKRFLSAS